MAWPILFLHEFPDQNLANIIGAPGKLISSSPSPTVSNLTNPTVTLMPGLWFGVEFISEVKDIIGVDVRLKAHIPATRGKILLCRLGLSFSLELEYGVDSLYRTDFIDGMLHVYASLTVRVDGTQTTISDIPIPHRRSFNVRVNWHTSGQLRIEFDGSLIGYTPTMAPTGMFNISNIVFGNPNADPHPMPRVNYTWIQVKVLRQFHSINQIGASILPEPVEPSSEIQRCLIASKHRYQMIIEIIRNFMRSFTMNHTFEWSQNSGQYVTPFTNEAIQAHKHATEALQSLV